MWSIHKTRITKPKLVLDPATLTRETGKLRHHASLSSTEGRNREKPPMAVLIDADNVRFSHAPALFEAVKNHGDANIRRIYGNFNQKNPWNQYLESLSMIPVQQFGHTSGSKNASDIALVIDAMNLLHTDPSIEVFAIVSSDSDFTRLAQHLRERHKTVIGFGEPHTPEAFRTACSIFFSFDNLPVAISLEQEIGGNFKDAELTHVPSVELMHVQQPKFNAIVQKAFDYACSQFPDFSTKVPEITGPSEDTKSSTCDSKPEKELSKAKAQILEALSEGADGKGWVPMSVLGARLGKCNPAFTSKVYGYRKLTNLLEATEAFEWKEGKGGKRFIRAK